MSSHSQDKHPFYFPVPEDSFRPSVVEFIDFDRPLSLHWVPTSIARFGRLVLLERSSKRTRGIFEHEIFPQPHNFFSILKLNGFKIFPDIPKKFVTFPGSLEFHDIFRFSRFPGRVATLIYQREEDRSEFESKINIKFTRLTIDEQSDSSDSLDVDIKRQHGKGTFLLGRKFRTFRCFPPRARV